MAIARSTQALLLVASPAVMQREPIGVIGAGWVGLVTAACFAELGHEVCARDIVPEKVESLSRGEVPIHEPGLPELVRSTPSGCTSPPRWATCCTTPGCCSCCVDTPPTYSGDADLSRVEAVIRDLGELGRARAGDEEHRAGGHRPLDPAPPRRLGYVRTPSS